MKGVALAAAVLVAAAAPPVAGPLPPCAARAAPVAPAYGAAGGPPAVATWHDLALDAANTCGAAVRGRMKLVVALAGRLRRGGGIDAVAARIGAISATKGLPYWSTTDQRWRPLITEAYAVTDPRSRARRADFSAAEVLSGRPLYFVQADSRSTGLNLYRLSAHAAGPERLRVEMVNLTTVRFLLLPLFEPEGLVSLHYVEALGPDAWGYYGLSGVRDGMVEGHEDSFVNRAAAFYRFLDHRKPDADPPLAR